MFSMKIFSLAVLISFNSSIIVVVLNISNILNNMVIQKKFHVECKMTVYKYKARLVLHKIKKITIFIFLFDKTFLIYSEEFNGMIVLSKS